MASIAAAAFQGHDPRTRGKGPGEERDHATNGTVAIEVRGTTLEHFDAVERAFGHAAPVDPLTPGITRRNAIEQHDGAPFIDAADGNDLRRTTHQAAGARQLDAGNLTQHVL